MQGIFLQEMLKLSPAKLVAMSDADVATAVAGWDKTRNDLILQADLNRSIQAYLAKGPCFISSSRYGRH